MGVPKVVFTYWEGPQPDYIRFCLELMRLRAGVSVVVLTPDNLAQYVDDTVLNPNYKSIMAIAQKVDCIRLAVLHQNGGMWCDADTLVFQSLEPLFETDALYTGFRWTKNQLILNGYFWAAKGSVVLEHCIQTANTKLAAGPKAVYDEAGGCFFGEYVLYRAAVSHINRMRFLPIETLIPVEFPLLPKGVWWSNRSIVDFITPQTRAVALNHSQFGRDLTQPLVTELAKNCNLIGSIFRFAQGYLDYYRPIQVSVPKTYVVGVDKNEIIGPENPDWMRPWFRRKHGLPPL